MRKFTGFSEKSWNNLKYGRSMRSDAITLNFSKESDFTDCFFLFLFIILRRYKFLIYKFKNSTMNINPYTN